MKNDSCQQPFSRRKFVTGTLQLAGGMALLGGQALFARDQQAVTRRQYTVQEIIDLILKEGGLTPINNTVDTIKAGDAGQFVTGILTTMFATITVIEEAVKKQSNLIIAHEPTFYNGSDDLQWVKNNSLVRKKQDLLAKNKIAIWRFHDYCHALKPDAISYGVAKKMGWLPYFKTGQYLLTIPPARLDTLVQQLKSLLEIGHVRVIGDADHRCEKIALLPGAWGGQRQVSAVETNQPDVLIVGEAVEWETVEYMRDSHLLGGKTALIILGHSVSEEPGMEWVAEWLQPRIPELPVSHYASRDPFNWL